MEAKFILFCLERDKDTLTDKVYCLTCAVKAIQSGAKIDLSGRGYSCSSHDMRSNDTCCECGKVFGMWDTIDL